MSTLFDMPTPVLDVATNHVYEMDQRQVNPSELTACTEGVVNNAQSYIRSILNVVGGSISDTCVCVCACVCVCVCVLNEFMRYILNRA